MDRLRQYLIILFLIASLVSVLGTCFAQNNKHIPQKQTKSNIKSQGSTGVKEPLPKKSNTVETRTQYLQETNKKMPQDTVGSEARGKDVQDTTQTSYEEKKPLEQIIRSSADLEVDGLIVDETITKFGRDFYNAFHQHWEAPAMVKNYTVHIKEFPTRGVGALIQISVNDEAIFEQQMPPRFDVIEDIAQYAVAVVTEYLVNNQLKQQLENDRKRAIEKF